MNLTEYKAKEIRYPHGAYRLGKASEVFYKGSFYRSDGTHIFDKHKILSIEKGGERIEVKMKNKDVVLIV